MISIIMPVLNEEKTIENTLKQLIALKGEKEIIVVDGGSSDDTVKIASKYCKVINSKKGRSYQMNQGARVAKGHILWFVHSDSIVSVDCLESIEKAIDEGYVGGGFSIYFYDLDTRFMRFAARSSNWRAKGLGLFFGDQAIFVKKSVFHELGGFKEIEIMEDWDFSRRLVKRGRMKLLDTKVGTSARRFKEGGQLRTLLLMHKIKILYILGVSPFKLSKMYKEAR